MKIITDLSGVITTEPFLFPQGHVSTIHFEVTPGCFLSVALGIDGLVVHRGGVGVGIKLMDLVNLAGALSPEVAALVVPAKPGDCNPS